MSTERLGNCAISAMQSPWMMTLNGRILAGAAPLDRASTSPSAMRDTRFIRTLPPFEPSKVSQAGLAVKRRRVNESLRLGGGARLHHKMLSLDTEVGLNCWWVWRKGLDLLENEFGL